MQSTIPDKDKTRVVGHLTPFVEVKGDRVRTLDTCQASRNIRREHAERTVCPIHVEPHSFSLSDTGDSVEIVDSTYIDRPGSRGDEEGSQAGAFVLNYCFFERLDIHLVLPVHGDDAEYVASQSSHVHGLSDATVGVRRRVGRPAFGGGCATFAARARAERLRGRDQDGHTVAHRLP